MIENTDIETTKIVKTDTSKWQNNLLPFMSKTLVILAIFFFIATLIQLIYLQQLIINNPKINLSQSLSALNPNQNYSHNDILETTRLNSLVLLEAGSVQNQYYQANMLLISRLWISYIGFVTGMIMAIVGAVFILGKLSESPSELKAQFSGNNISFKSASPGLILSFLGTCLMVTTLVVHHEINSKYNAIYIHDVQPTMPLSNDNSQPFLRPGILRSDINDSIKNSK